MARTDENGKNVQAMLSYELNRAVPAKEIYTALGIARNTYHNRSEEDTFPNAEECRLIALGLGLSPLLLLVRFGLITDEDLEPYRGSVAIRMPEQTRAKQGKKITEMTRNPDVTQL